MLTTFMKWIASAALLGGLLLPVFLGNHALGYHAGCKSWSWGGRRSHVPGRRDGQIPLDDRLLAWWRACSTPSCRLDSPPRRPWS